MGFLAALFNACTTAAWNILDVLSSETFPTCVRGSAMGVLASSGRVGSMVAQFINAYLSQSGSPVVIFLVTACTLAVGALASLLTPTLDTNALVDVVSDEHGANGSGDDDDPDSPKDSSLPLRHRKVLKGTNSPDAQPILSTSSPRSDHSGCVSVV